MTSTSASKFKCQCQPWALIINYVLLSNKVYHTTRNLNTFRDLPAELCPFFNYVLLPKPLLPPTLSATMACMILLSLLTQSPGCGVIARPRILPRYLQNSNIIDKNMSSQEMRFDYLWGEWQTFPVRGTYLKDALSSRLYRLWLLTARLESAL